MKTRLTPALLALTASALAIHTARADFDGPYAFFNYPASFTTSHAGPCGSNWLFVALPLNQSTLSVSAGGVEAEIDVVTNTQGTVRLLAHIVTNGVFHFSWQVSGAGFLPECGFASNGVQYPFQLAGSGSSAQGTFSSSVTTNDTCGWYMRVYPGTPSSLTISNFTVEPAGGGVVFADTNLEAAVRAQLGIPTGDLTPSDLLALTSLDASSQNIVNLQGLEWAANLTFLHLTSNPLTNTAALTSLINLNDLSLMSCGYPDASQLAGLTNLQYLYLSGNPLTDVMPLAGLTHLLTLDLGFDQVTDISPLTNLTQVSDLWLQVNNISNAAPLATMPSIRHLVVGDNPLTNPAALAPARWLANLALDRVGLEDVSWLAGFTNLHWLYLDGNPITNHCALSALGPQLYELTLPDTGLSDLSCFGACTNLTYLGLAGNTIGDLSPVTALRNLNFLDASWNQLFYLPGGLTNLPLHYFFVNQNYLDLDAGSPDLAIINTLLAKGVYIADAQLPAPFRIVMQPADQSVPVGGTATFTVVVSNNTVPLLAYQWQFDGAQMLGAEQDTNSPNPTLTLTLPDVQPGQVGTYRVELWDAGGGFIAWSAPAHLNTNINMAFTTGGDSDWFLETTNVHSPPDAWQSGPLLPGQQTWLQTTVTGPGTLSFWWSIDRVSSDLEFDVDGDYMDDIYDSVPWLNDTFSIPAGTHDLTWAYHQDMLGPGANAGWVGDVLWTPESVACTPPTITTPLTNLWKYPGETVLLSVEADGAEPLSYQWYSNSLVIPGAVGSNYGPFVAAYSSAGSYSVTVTNACGAATNSAKLVVAPVFYETVDLGSLWPIEQSYPQGLNNRGEVVGYTTNFAVAGQQHAWVWSGGVFTDLGDGLGGGVSAAYGINDQGDIVGSALVPGTTNYNALRWRKVGANYVVDDLGRTNRPTASAQAINNAGDIAFNAVAGSYVRDAYLWREGVLKPLGGLVAPWGTNADQPRGWTINSLGFITGSCGAMISNNWTLHAWLYNGVWRQNLHEGGPVSTISLGGSCPSTSGGYALNNYGEVAGAYGGDSGWVGNFLVTGTNLLDLGAPNRVVGGLNDQGDVALGSDGGGLFCSTNAHAPARLADGRPDYADHQYFSLMDLLASDTNGLAALEFYWDAYARINNARQIIANGWNASGLRPILLRPLPRAGNIAPIAGNDTVTNHGGSLVVPIATLLANDTDADGDALALLTADGHSTNNATIRRSGSALIYTPAAAPSAVDTFTYTVLDFHGGQATATVSVFNQPAGPTPPPQQLALLREFGPTPLVRFHAAPGQTWRIQASDGLPGGPWTTLATAIAGPDGGIDVTDAVALTRPYRFYRAVSP